MRRTIGEIYAGDRQSRGVVGNLLWVVEVAVLDVGREMDWQLCQMCDEPFGKSTADPGLRRSAGGGCSSKACRADYLEAGFDQRQRRPDIPSSRHDQR